MFDWSPDSLSARLKDVRILVTRPVHQSENLLKLISLAGGIAVKFPTLDIVATDNIDQIKSTLAELGNYQWLVFISANAVNFALKANGGKIERLNSLRKAAIGLATARAMALAGLPADLLPEQGYSTEALLIMPQLQQINGQHFLIARGEGGREQLADILRERGATVDYLEVYKRKMPRFDCSEVHTLLAANKLDAITITSGETLENLLAMLTDHDNKRLLSLPLVVVSDRIRQMAADKGFTKIAVADGPSDMAMLEAVTMLMGK
jgi:uroporphyrinogen-III synthase